MCAIKKAVCVLGLWVFMTSSGMAASANNFVGSVFVIQGEAGVTHVLLNVGVLSGSSECPAPFFAFEIKPNDTVGKTFYSTLIVAQSLAKKIRVNGSGLCDPYSGFETIQQLILER